MAEFPLRLPCIKVSQEFGDFYIFSIESKTLRDVAYWIPATAQVQENGLLKFLGVQRRMSPSRAKSIGEYIDTEDVTFPNTIIVSANYDESDEFVTDEEIRWSVEEGRDKCLTLLIPTSRKLASVIDGQHRLEGFKYAKNPDREAMQLPCAVYLDLPKAYQANIFATINFNQARVDKSLAYQLFGYDLEEKDNARWTPNLAALFIARVLNAEKDSPLRGHIKLALSEINNSSPPLETWSVSLAAVVGGVEKLISTYPARDKNLLLSGKVSSRSDLEGDSGAPLRQLYLSKNDRAIYRTVEDFFKAMAEQLWHADRPSGSFITRTIGIMASFDILRQGLLQGKIQEADCYNTTRQLLAQLPRFNFSDPFFNASGTGRLRIRNVLGTATGLISPHELSDDALDQLNDFLVRSGQPELVSNDRR